MHRFVSKIGNILTAALLFALLCPITQASELDQKLMDAVQALDEVKVENLLQQGADPNWRYKFENYNGMPILNYINSSSYDIEDREQKQIKIAQLLLDNGFSLKATPYILFLTRSSYNLTKFFLEKGADPNCVDGKGRPLLQVVINDFYSDRERVAKLLLEFGATPLNESTSIRFQLSQAARKGDLLKVKQLQAEGIYIDSPDLHQKTALYNAVSIIGAANVVERGGREAARLERLDLILFLLDKGADTSIETIEGNLLHTLASITGFRPKTDEERLKYVTIIEKIIKGGAHVSFASRISKSTPLHNAARWNDVILAETLLKNHAKIMPRNFEGKTPLDFAEAGDMIKLLKDHGATEQ